jgi:hypothetical protein
MDDYEFDANVDRLGYQLDCIQLTALRARTEYLALGGAPCTSPHQLAAARDRWQQLEARHQLLRQTLGELRVVEAA